MPTVILFVLYAINITTLLLCMVYVYVAIIKHNYDQWYHPYLQGTYLYLGISLPIIWFVYVSNDCYEVLMSIGAYTVGWQKVVMEALDCYGSIVTAFFITSKMEPKLK